MKLFGYSISLNVLILIGVLYLIMVVNALSGSCNREGLSANDVASKLNAFVSQIKRLPRPLSSSNKAAITSQMNQLSSMTSDPAVKNKINSVAATVSRM